MLKDSEFAAETSKQLRQWVTNSSESADQKTVVRVEQMAKAFSFDVETGKPLNEAIGPLLEGLRIASEQAQNRELATSLGFHLGRLLNRRNPVRID